MANTWGNKLKLSIFGESHGEGIGIVIDGLPPGFQPDMDFVAAELNRRAPGKNPFATARQESDQPRILSGLFNGKCTGAPLCGFIENTDARSRDYYPDIMRPSHADYGAYVKYGGFNDYRGGGHFSGRLTATLVFAGALAKLLLLQQGIKIGARILSIEGIQDGPCGPELLPDLPDRYFPVCDEAAGAQMKEAIARAKSERDSVGGVVECAVMGVPAGLGEPFFGSLESSIAQMVFSIPAVKGIEFGAGFEITGMRGSKANDGLEIKDGKVLVKTNNNGGITGGITNGAPVVFRAGIKPTATISQEQSTVNIKTTENVTVELTGRHDPCIVPRAVVVMEAAAAVCVLDAAMMLRSKWEEIK